MEETEALKRLKYETIGGDGRDCCKNTIRYQQLWTIELVTGCIFDVVLYLLPFVQHTVKRVATAVVC